MHVVYLHQYFTTPKHKGGTRSYEMALRLLRAGHQVSMVCGISDLVGAKSRSRDCIRESVDGIDVYRIPEPYSNHMGFARRWLAFLRFAKRAYLLTKTLQDVDLVFATSTPLTIGDPGRKAARHHRCPFVFEVRDLWPKLPIAVGLVKSWPLKWYLKRMELRAYRAATRVIALAPGMKDGVAETGYPADRISMIPNCCDLELFRPTDSRAEIDADSRFGEPGDFRLVYAGAHGLANGLDSVLDAIQVLKNRGVRGVRFCFLGDGGMKPHLVARCENEGLSDYCRWFDWTSKRELATFLPQMDVGMLIFKNVPAFYRGTSPNKFFDYIASGLPVLNNYPGWVADHLRETRCGVVVPPDDPEAFADAVVDLAGRRDELNSMGQQARQLAATTFSRDALGKNFVDTLETAHREYNANSS